MIKYICHRKAARAFVTRAPSLRQRVSWLHAVLVLICGHFLSGAPAEAAGAPKSKLYATSREALAADRARGARTFSVLVASRSGKNPQVVDAIQAFGGHIDWRSDDVDYVRATLPIDKVEIIAERVDVQAIEANGDSALLNANLPDAEAAGASPTSESDLAALTQPYDPGRDLQTSALRARTAYFDGRGVTVAVLDQMPDFLLPELQFARKLDGSPTRKFVDLRTSIDPQSDDPSSPWIATRAVQAVGKVFTVDGVTYRAPYDGPFRFGKGDTKNLRRIWASIVDPKSAQSPGIEPLDMLWDEASGAVWVDTTLDHDFGDKPSLREFELGGDYGLIPVPPGDPRSRATLGFAVQVDIATHSVALLFGSGFHGSGSAGSIAANKQSGGQISGVAPGARLYWISPGASNSSVTEGVIEAERSPEVDLVALVLGVDLKYARHDGQSVPSIIYERAAQLYGKLIVQPAGNYDGLSQALEPCAARMVLCVGAYQHKDAYATNFGINVSDSDNLHFRSSFGPTGNGALKPTVLAPSGWLSLAPGFASASTLNGVYALPPGYQIFGGTSQAAPTAAGALAILIGAAKAEHLDRSAALLLDAVSSTARFLPTLPAYVQGGGLLQIGAALEELKKRNRALGHIEFGAPVRTATSASLPQQDRGVGLFEREGWSVGLRDRRAIWITRTDGTAGVAHAYIDLVGNDGTFRCTKKLDLRLNRRRALLLDVAPRTPGVHSAILQVRSTNGTILGRTLLTIVAAEELTARNHYAVARKINVERPGFADVFIRVPNGARALIVRTSSKHHSLPGGFGFAYRPYGPDSSLAIPNLIYTIPFGSRQDVYPRPQPGTWELIFFDTEDQGEGDAPPHHVRTVSSIPIRVDAFAIPNEITRKQHRGVTSARPLVVVSRASAQVSSHENTLRYGQQNEYKIEVPAGALGIGANLSGKRSRLVLYLLDCHNGEDKCEVKERNLGGEGVAAVYYARPSAGLWKVVVGTNDNTRNDATYKIRSFYLSSRPSSKCATPALVYSARASDIYFSTAEDHGVRPQNGVFDVRLSRLAAAKPGLRDCDGLGHDFFRRRRVK